VITPNGLPHSESSGSMRLFSSPKIFAGKRVLHRLLMPRHPPAALTSLTKNLFLEQTVIIREFLMLELTELDILIDCSICLILCVCEVLSSSVDFCL
jgi:hypothetical protein